MVFNAMGYFMRMNHCTIAYIDIEQSLRLRIDTREIHHLNVQHTNTKLHEVIGTTLDAALGDLTMRCRA